MADYFLKRPDPERGFALAALTGGLSFPVAKPNLLRELVFERVDPFLYSLSRDYVGDMAETIALLWPEKDENGLNHAPALEDVIETLSHESRQKLKDNITHWLDALDASARWALLKVITGNIRIGVSARLAKTALSDAFRKDVGDIEQLWHGLTPPYLSLFSWLEGKSEKPEITSGIYFTPMMLAHPITDEELAVINFDDFQIELKWDGIRAQIVKAGEKVALYSRTGDEITSTFPDLEAALKAIPHERFCLDGELLATQNGAIAPFNALQQRLNRKKVTAAMLNDYPVHLRLYDMLADGAEDLRGQPLKVRRAALEVWNKTYPSEAIDLSEIIQKPSRERLIEIHGKARTEERNGVEGLMLKRSDSPYVAGRPRGLWFKWKRKTLILDCILMYAQRGSGKRSSFYSDYTFGVWQSDRSTIVPVGKAYSGFTDEELFALDKWIRAHTTNRFGPVREVEPHLVIEIEFDSIQVSNRHKSGIAMRFPRVHRIRWDKPANEADTLEAARALIATE